MEVLPIILIVEDWNHNEIPKPTIRWDLAWPLFLPDFPGDIPQGHSRSLVALAHWFWEAMGQITGFLNPDAPERIWFLTPYLTLEAREFVIRLASFWSTQIYCADSEESTTFDPLFHTNCWIAPVANLHQAPPTQSARARLSDPAPDAAQYLMPLLGVGRAFVRVEEIAAGHASARLHSHSAIDEYYLILQGEATLRMGDKEIILKPGDFIAKPTGPDLTSHIWANKEQSVKILDMEIWPDSSLSAKDLVSYPDHRELFLRGQGWGAILPLDILQSPKDFRQHYDDGYTRTTDHRIIPRAIPGHPPRPNP